MNILLFVTAWLTAVISGYYWSENKEDAESVKIYRTIVLISALVIFASGVSFIPEEFLEHNVTVVFFLSNGIIIAMMIISFIQIMVQTKYSRKKKLLYCALFAIAIISYGAFAQKQIATVDTDSSGAMQEASYRAEVAKQFAEKQLMQDKKLSKTQIVSTSFGFQTNTPVNYIIAFSYRNEKDAEEIYGYRIAVDDNKNCTILKQGETVGEQILETTAEESSVLSKG